jgi:hypothetical protein
LDSTGTATWETLAQIQNNDTDGAVTTALEILSAAGAITTAIDVSDAEIGNAINIGANPLITGNVAGTIGDSTTDSWTFTTDGTGDSEIGLPADSVGPAEIDSTTGAYDFGGVTSLEVPNAAAPTVDAAGEIAVDTSDDQLIYYGGAKRVLSYERTRCALIENVGSTDDNVPLGSFVDAVTITSVWCTYTGTGTTVATFTLEDGSGNAMTHTAPTCTAIGTVPTAQSVTAAGGLTARESLRFDTTNTPAPTSDDYELCVSYTVDAQ